MWHQNIRFRSFASHCAEGMSFFRGRGARRGAGIRRGHREKDEINRAVSIGRHRGSTTYQFTEKQSRSLSELSSLTDVSLSDLTDVEIDLNSSLLKVNLFELRDANSCKFVSACLFKRCGYITTCINIDCSTTLSFYLFIYSFIYYCYF